MNHINCHVFRFVKKNQIFVNFFQIAVKQFFKGVLLLITLLISPNRLIIPINLNF
jgi:hypothetical protein